MAGNSNLHMSRNDKADEFYTQLSLIESELKHYRQHFRGKTVLCNCDDPYESNFFKYFAMNFNALGLKKLITTCYAISPVTGKEFQYYMDNGGQLSFVPSASSAPVQEENERKPYKVEITEVTDENGDGRIDLSDVEYLMRNKKNTMTLLEGDGDFRSPECVELLKEADIVVTNPPFSLFRDYVALLMQYNGHYWFMVPDSYEEKKTDFKIDESGQKWRRMGNICWFTNLDIEKRHEDMTLFRTYSPDNYPKYDNYDAIEVSKTADIPCDYDGYMGVPITFMQYYNPEQFEIAGLDDHRVEWVGHGPRLNGKVKYRRVIIRRKQVNTNEN